MWTARRPPGGTGGCVPRRPVVNFLWPFRGGDFPRCPWQPWHSSFISISAGATLLPDSCVQVQLRAFEQLPIYTLKGHSNKAGLNLRRLFPLYMCVRVRARGRLGSCQVRPQQPPLPKSIRTTRIISTWSWRPASTPWRHVQAQCQQHCISKTVSIILVVASAKLLEPEDAAIPAPEAAAALVGAPFIRASAHH